MAVDENEYLAAIREITDTVGSLCADIWIDEIIEHAEARTALLAQAEANAERWKRTARLRHDEHRVGPEHPAAGRGWFAVAPARLRTTLGSEQGLANPE